MKQIPSACPVRSDRPLSKAADIAYIRLGRENLESASEYYQDFGLDIVEKKEDRILFRGNSSDLPCWSLEKADRDFLIGLGIYLHSSEDFERLKTIPGAEFLQNGRINSIPCVTLFDPSGLPVDVMYVPEEKNKNPIDPTEELWNYPGESRRANLPRPCESRPSKINRLGHAVFLKQEFLKNASWYCDTFGMIPSDIQILPESKEPVIVFLRFDRGEILSDHHSIVIASGITDSLEHCAFELKDLDEVATGREWLLGKGYHSSWGIGRHLLGSQIFDYHRDPAGMLVEHYADGDKFDNSVPTGIHLINRKSLYQWGENMPKDFLDTKLSLQKLLELWKGIISGRRISIPILIELKKVAEISPRTWIKY
ncbi:VOC family protein [Leptospira haakeii]|uniref:Extradiol dioxygenase n=1 Tax=Leptospira haakeii TaxID=2023198 RepID=A0ABX4PII0_9LEPT|nr:VOC family protein [Leptospira haakeii]PKA15597.1 extradiol dioxygenase [Leptospira haakeii]PKA18964.1 extradiol dioxygenase [Leptospira haakeii]